MSNARISAASRLKCDLERVQDHGGGLKVCVTIVGPYMLGERRVFGRVYRVPKEDHLRPDSRQRRRLNGIVVHFGLGLDSAQVEIDAHGETSCN